MRPAKTDLARDALRTRSAGLGALERHVLILSNGKRTREEILTLLGGAAQAALERLLRDGFLRDPAAPAVDSATEPADAMPTPPATAATTGAASSRRSVAAAKLYMLDMLQLQRGPDASVIATALRASREAADVARHISAALDHVRGVTTASYVARVAARLAEVAPPELLALVDAPAADREDTRAA